MVPNRPVRQYASGDDVPIICHALLQAAFDQKRPSCTHQIASGSSRLRSLQRLVALRETIGRLVAGSGSPAFEWLANPPSLTELDAQPSEQASTARDL